MPIRQSVRNRKPSLQDIANMSLGEGRLAMSKHYPSYGAMSIKEEATDKITDFFRLTSLKDNHPASVLIDKLGKLIDELDAENQDLTDQLEDLRAERQREASK